MKSAKMIASILIIASIVISVGCSSKKVTTTQNTTNSQTRKFDPAAMKTSYENVLKSLVTAGTITQAQSDKVLEAVTTNSQGTRINKTAGTGNQNPANKPSGTRLKNNQLSALVTSGVITQTQADTINQKIQEARKNSQSNLTK